MRAISIALVALAAAAATGPTMLLGQAATPEVLILSPEPGDRVPGHEVLIAFSFDAAAVRLLVDGVDVTAQTQIGGNVATWTPGGPMAQGPHRIAVTMLDSTGAAIGESTWSFAAAPLTDAQVAHVKASGNAEVQAPPPAWQPRGTIILSGVTSSASGAGADFTRQKSFQPNLWLNAGASLGNGWRYSTHIHASGDESSTQQPVNQYRLDVRGPSLRMGLGDVHPVMHDLILSGQRVRGGQVELKAGPARLSVVAGQTRRAVPSLVNTADGAVLRSGTFGQSLFAVRPAIGSGQRFQAGLTVMRVRDDIGSIEDIRIPTSSVTSLRSANPPPKDNLVGGLDFTFRFANGRVLAQYANAISLFANDISQGPLTRAGMDSVTDAAGISRLDIDPRDYKSYFILNASVIPFDPRTLTNVAHQFRTTMQLGSHVVGAEIFSIGASYNSLGYSALQRDRRGIRVYDSFTLLDNGLVASFGYDRDRDNLDEARTATTTAQGAFGNLSWQKSHDAVLLTLSGRFGSRSNGLGASDDFAVDESHHALLAGVGVPVGTVAGLRTRINLNASLIERSDPANAGAGARDIYYLGGVQAQTADRGTDVSLAYGLNQSEFGGAGTTDFGRIVFSGRRQFTERIAGLVDGTHTTARSDGSSLPALQYDRLELMGGAELEMPRAMFITVNGGMISFNNDVDSNADTRETVVRLSVRRAF